jgi:copper transporter 1
MLWNWYTVDSCFLARSWHVTSNGMFAGSCIGVVLLVIALEFLRRSGKEYDHYILREYQKKLTAITLPSPGSSTDHGKNGAALTARGIEPVSKFRPTVLQQAIRALLHMTAFAVAYFIMLYAHSHTDLKFFMLKMR